MNKYICIKSYFGYKEVNNSFVYRKSNKSNFCIEEGTIVLINFSEEGYVDIFELTQKLYFLNQLVGRIEEISITENDLGLMNYQLSLRAAYIAEFEHSYQEIGCKPISYNDYKRTRSTL